jgi:DNA mismatch repair protein MutH
MKFKTPQFEFKHLDKEDWEEVSELVVLEKIVDRFGRITPVLTEMLQGKEIITPDGVFRMKNCGNEGKDYYA